MERGSKHEKDNSGQFVILYFPILSSFFYDLLSYLSNSILCVYCFFLYGDKDIERYSRGLLMGLVP